VRERTRLVVAAGLLATLAQGCLLGGSPFREPLDRIWEEWMLAAHYGFFRGGKEEPWPIVGEDKIVSSPVGASDSKYGIEIQGSTSGIGGAYWNLTGGLLARVATPKGLVELFGKEIVRVHLPFHTAKYGRDYSYEFFLVARSHPTARGQLIKRWFFPAEELAMTIDPQTEELLRRAARSEDEAKKRIEQNMSHKIDGYLRLDLDMRAAVVTISGLKRPFEERVEIPAQLFERGNACCARQLMIGRVR